MANEPTGSNGIKIETEWKGYNAGEIARRGAAEGLARGAEHIRDVSVSRAPMDTTALRDSATASHDAGTLAAAVSFDTPYAVRQHEELDFQHPTGEAKFLESTLASERDTVARLIQAEIRKALGT